MTSFPSRNHIILTKRDQGLLSRVKHFFKKFSPSSTKPEDRSLQKPFLLRVSQWSDTGHKRSHNEDSVAYIVPKDAHTLARKGALLIVADGMGGHAAGEVASHMAVDQVCKTYYQDEDEDVESALLGSIKYANTLIHRYSMEHSGYGGMGTTCVAAVIHNKKLLVANVGDSRAYLLHDGQLKQISQDHSWVAEQIRAGILAKEDAHQHIMRNMVTRSVGGEAEVQVDLFTEPLAEGDTILLCSDGLSGLVSEDEMRTIIEQYPPQESAYRLIALANEQGGIDNSSAIVARISFNS